MKIWQMHDINEWRFGEMVRGAVRMPYLAEIYYDEDKGWVWFTMIPGEYNGPRGVEGSFGHAMYEAEKVLEEKGIIVEE